MSRIRFFEESTDVIVEPGFAAAWVSHDDPLLFGPAHDPQTGVRLLTSGRTAWDEEEWSRAEGLTGLKGGLANRILLDRFLEHGIAALKRFDGACAVLAWDPRSRTVHLSTDQFGYHPVFLYNAEAIDGTVIGTCADAIADDPIVSTMIDEVSVAEFLSAWRVTPPNSYYKGIRYAGAATHHEWDLHRMSYRRAVYWTPHASDVFPSCEAAGEEIASAVTRAIRVRTSRRLSPVVCFASGGMDSRAVLFAAANPSGLTAFNLFDQPNHETAIARRLSDAAGVRYHGFQRDPDYYPRLFPEGVRLSGGMWSHEDNHYLGTREAVLEQGARTVMTACTTDWLFKGYGLEKAYRQLFRRNLPLKRFENRRVDGFLPNVPRPVPKVIEPEVRRRMDDWFDGAPRELLTDGDRLVVEDRRVRPTCYAVSVSGPIMYRIFPYDTFLGDSRVATCYARTPAAWKLNADAWAAAVNRICKGATGIEDANFGWRVGSSSAAKIASFARGWIGRRLGSPRLPSAGLATEGSWPNLSWYVSHSRTLKDLWAATSSPTKEVIRDAWGSDPWTEPLESWATRTSDLFRVMTMVQFLDRKVASSFGPSE